MQKDFVGKTLSGGLFKIYNVWRTLSERLCKKYAFTESSEGFPKNTESEEYITKDSASNKVFEVLVSMCTHKTQGLKDTSTISERLNEGLFMKDSVRNTSSEELFLKDSSKIIMSKTLCPLDTQSMED